jgi:CRP-like cAMP-binding protein
LEAPVSLLDSWGSLVGQKHLSSRELAAGEALFRQGDPIFAVYVVQTGIVRLLRHLEDGSSVLLHRARAGESFAEASLWAKAYHCDGVAEGPTVVTVIPKRSLLEALQGNPGASLALARALAGQVRTLRSRLELRNVRSARQRVLAWLCLQADGSPPSLTLDRPWTQIADEIGLTHEAIYRALAELQAEGLIQRDQRRIILSSAATLPQR